MARRVVRVGFGLLLVAGGLVGAGGSVRADHETRDGLYTETHYISVQFSYQFQWENPWEADLDTVDSIEGESDRIVVRGPDAEVECLFTFEEDLEDALDAVIATRTEIDANLEVVARVEGEPSGEFGQPYIAATLAYEGPGPDGEVVPLVEYVEVLAVFPAEGGSDGGTLAASIRAPEADLADAYTEVQTDFLANFGLAGSFFAGEPTDSAGGGWIDPRS